MELTLIEKKPIETVSMFSTLSLLSPFHSVSPAAYQNRVPPIPDPLQLALTSVTSQPPILPPHIRVKRLEDATSADHRQHHLAGLFWRQSRPTTVADLLGAPSTISAPSTMARSSVDQQTTDRHEAAVRACAAVQMAIQQAGNFVDVCRLLETRRLQAEVSRLDILFFVSMFGHLYSS